MSEKKVKKNYIRSITKSILKLFKKNDISDVCLGLLYVGLHYIIMITIGFILLFNINIVHLCCALIVVSLDALSIVVLHGCPLTNLEEKYLKTNTSTQRYNWFKHCHIVYTCKHEYEKQIELLVNVWLLVAIKCLVLIFLNTFHYNLQNVNHVYA